MLVSSHKYIKSLDTNVKTLATHTCFLWSLCTSKWKCSYVLISPLRELIFEPKRLVLLIWTKSSVSHLSLGSHTTQSDICFFIIGISSHYLSHGKLENHTQLIIRPKKAIILPASWMGWWKRTMFRWSGYFKCWADQFIFNQFIEQEAKKKGREKQLCKHQGARHILFSSVSVAFFVSLFFFFVHFQVILGE